MAEELTNQDESSLVVGIPLLVVKQHKITIANAKARHLLEIADDAFITKSIIDFFPLYQGDGQLSEKRWAATLEYLGNHAQLVGEWKLKGNAGTLVDVELTITPIARQDGLYEIILYDISDKKRILATIRESELKFRTLADNAPVLLKMTNARNLYVFFSSQWLRFVGGNEGDVLDNAWLNYIHEADLQALLQTLDLAYKRRRRYKVAYRIRRQDGVYRTVEDEGVPYFDLDGFFMGYISSGSDITDSLELETLQRQRDVAANLALKLQDILQGAGIAALSLDSEGKIIFANQYLQKNFGEQLVGTKWSDFFELEQDSQQSLSELLLPESVGKTFVLKTREIRKEPLVLRCNILYLDTFETFDAKRSSLIVGENITDQVRIRARLDESNKRLEEFLSNASDSIAVFTNRGKLRYANSALLTLLQLKSTNLRSANLIQYVDEEYRADFKANLVQAVKTENISFETVLKVGPSSQKRFVQINLAGKKLNSSLTEYQALIRDTTDFFRAERAKSLYNSIIRVALESSNLQILFEGMFAELHNQLNVNNALILLEVGYGRKTLIQYAYGDGESRITEKSLELGKDLLAFAYHKGAPLRLEHEELVELIWANKIVDDHWAPQSWVSVPLKIGGQLIGLLAIFSRQRKSTYIEDELDQLAFISSQLALSIQRKQYQETIQKQAASLQAIFDSASHSILSLDFDLNLEAYNQNAELAFEAILRKKLSTGANLYDLLPTGDFKSRLLAGVRHAQHGKAERIELAAKSKRLSSEIWYELFVNPVFFEHGQIGGISIIGHDITTRKSSEIGLKKSEAKYRNIFNSFQDIFFQMDKAGKLQNITPSVFDVCGYKPEEVLDKNIDAFYLYSIRTKKAIKELITHRKLTNVQIPVVTKTGVVKTLLCSIHLALDETTNRLIFEGVCRDVTELNEINKKLIEAKEQAERSLKTKERFLANMSHEIRTPMNGVIGLMELLSLTKLNKVQNDYVLAIMASSQTLLTILNDILDLSKMEAGKMEIKRASVKASTILPKVQTLFKQVAAKKEIDLAVIHNGNDDLWIKCDETRLIQVLSNLTSNAIKFTDNGNINLSLHVTPEQSGGYKLLFAIQDTGIGIAPKQLPKLFRSFNQLDISSSKSYGGTGLGLSISQSLVKMMGGEISVESELGVGSIFSFDINVKGGTKTQPALVNHDLNSFEYGVRRAIG